MPPGQRIPVQFNQEGQPIGEYTSKFSHPCRVTEWNSCFAPFQVEKWADIPDHAKEMWKHIQEHANVGDHDERKKWVMQYLGKKFKNHRKKLKDEFYSKWETNEDRLGHPPPDVSMVDWTWLVQYWSSPKAQVVAKRNRINRSHQILKHTGGTKSFAHYKDEESRSRTDASIPPLDDRSEEINSKFKELSGMPEDGSCSFIGNDIYTQLMGPERHGRVRGYGLGPTPSSVFGSTSSQSRAHYEEMHTQLDDMRQEIEDLKIKHSEDMQMLREEMQRQRGEMQRKHNEMMEMVRQMMSGLH